MMQPKVANLLDRSVRYLDTGGGRSVIFLHAFPLSADQWLPQLHRLPPGWRGLAPDLRGFRGAGPAFEDPGLDCASMDSHAADVLAFMTHLEIDRAVLVGSSMGGYVALAMLRAAPARVAGLVLANTRATPDAAEGLAARDRLIAIAEREGAPGVARDMVSRLVGRSTLRQQPDLADVVRALIERNSTAGLTSAIRAMKLRRDSTPLLPAVACPALVISSDEDTIVPAADAASMVAAIPGAAAVTISRAGHLSNLEAPGAFNDALSRFLTRGGQGLS